MSGTYKDDFMKAARSAGDLARDIGNSVVEGSEKAYSFAKEKSGMGIREGSDAGPSGIKTRMGVIASCGKTVGTVDSVSSEAVKISAVQEPVLMTRTIPFSMIDHVDSHVHLNINSADFEKDLISSVI